MSYGELENGGGRQDPISLYADKKFFKNLNYTTQQ